MIVISYLVDFWSTSFLSENIVSLSVRPSVCPTVMFNVIIIIISKVKWMKWCEVYWSFLFVNKKKLYRLQQQHVFMISFRFWSYNQVGQTDKSLRVTVAFPLFTVFFLSIDCVFLCDFNKLTEEQLINNFFWMKPPNSNNSNCIKKLTGSEFRSHSRACPDPKPQWLVNDFFFINNSVTL